MLPLVKMRVRAIFTSGTAVKKPPMPVVMSPRLCVSPEP